MARSKPTEAEIQRDMLEMLGCDLADFMQEYGGRSAMVRAFVDLQWRLVISCNFFSEKTPNNNVWSPTPRIEFRKVIGDVEVEHDA